MGVVHVCNRQITAGLAFNGLHNVHAFFPMREWSSDRIGMQLKQV